MTHPPIAPPRRVLVVSLDQLGDLVFASSLVAPIAKRFPGVEIDVWCRDAYRGVAALVPGVREVFGLDPFWAGTYQGLGRRSHGRFADYLRCRREIAAAHHDVAVLAGAPWRTAAGVAGTRIPVRIGHARHRNAVFLTHVVEAPDRSQPVLAGHRHLLRPFGIHEDLHTNLDGTRTPERFARIRDAVGGPFVALHAFANDPARCVALTEWRTVADALSARGLRILWVGAPQELETVRGLARDSAWRFSDQVAGSAIDDLVTSIGAATMFVGHDSGPLHVANAMRIPSVGVFAPGEPARTFPQGLGAWRLVARARPADVAAADIIAALDELQSSLDYPR
jgi:ADP-heptose:LPS heptosyltransferase